MKRDSLLYAVNANIDPWARLRLAIVLRAIWDTDLIETGDFGYGYSARELIEFWRSEWAAELTNNADIRNYIERLERAL